jgi:DNA repair protein RecN (Recombination protein N)
MLQYLQIQNFALLEQVTLDFSAGLTALTGETGAGKSVLLGALSLLAGGRANKRLIREGADQLTLEAALYFTDVARIDRQLAQLELPLCEEGVLLLRRTLHQSKVPKIWVNGQLATLSQLQALGEHWIDFHGPHEPQKLFVERNQLRLLDAYAEQSAALSAYQQRYAQWRAQVQEISELEQGERLDEDTIAFYQAQLDRIDLLAPCEDSIERLERDFRRCSQAESLAQLSAHCADALLGDAGLTQQVDRLQGSVHELVQMDPDFESIDARLQSVAIELQDLGDELQRLSGQFEFEPELIEQLKEHMNLWQELRRKYGGSVAAVLSKREELARSLALQGDLEGIVAEKRAQAKQVEASLWSEAKGITQARRQAAENLSQQVAELLRSLGFKYAQFEIQVSALQTLSEAGSSQCQMRFSSNAGHTMQPLNKIASSGETARVMLALKTVLAEADATPILVFDEVDANVGGEVGRAVGAELLRLSAKHQVFCVTHLPQVAAQATAHVLVRKEMQQGHTVVSMQALEDDAEARKQELARMLGDRHSASARAHAEVLLAESTAALRQ